MLSWEASHSRSCLLFGFQITWMEYRVGKSSCLLLIHEFKSINLFFMEEKHDNNHLNHEITQHCRVESNWGAAEPTSALLATWWEAGSRCYLHPPLPPDQIHTKLRQVQAGGTLSEFLSHDIFLLAAPSCFRTSPLISSPDLTSPHLSSPWWMLRSRAVGIIRMISLPLGRFTWTPPQVRTTTVKMRRGVGSNPLKT